MQSQFLTPAQIEHFLARGFIKIEGAIERDVALRWGATGWARLGYDPNDVSTWAQSKHHLPYQSGFLVRDHAPDMMRAARDLAGPGWNNPDWDWGNGFIFNLGDDSGKEWVAPQDWEVGWHKDGDFFRHFLDSPEQALLTIVLWSDIEPQSGGTFLACDSVPVVARFLAEHPEGIAPGGFPFADMKRQCRDFEEATGRAGDVFLMHPYLLHTASRNWTRHQRIIANPVTRLDAPMKFNRENSADQTPVERAVLRGLGVESYDFTPTHERERIVPQRELDQRKMLAERS